jgi:ribosomal protein S12 methylthiotransferase
MPRPGPFTADRAPAVGIVTVGCGRADADSEELAGRLSAAGYRIAGDPARADAVVVNTCAFIAAAKKDSIDAVLAAADGGRPVLAVGCLAERYGDELAAALPEAAAVVGFDGYPGIAGALGDVLAGRPVPAHRPVDRRRLLPLAPAARRAAVAGPAGFRPPVPRRRLQHSPVAPLKLASGCDRRCSFCAIPAFRGAFVSREPDEVLAEAGWLAAQAVRELVLVSENSTSYGKDLGDLRALERLLPRLAAVDGIARVRVVYLQPAELRPGLVEVIAGTPGVAPYFDLSFQHASGPVLRRMRRFGDGDRFLDLIGRIRALAPAAGVRSNVIVGFPGETRADLAELDRFLAAARLDAVGVFGYSDEEGTQARHLPGKVRAEAVRRRVERVTRLAEELTAQRAEDRIGEEIEVLVEAVRGRRAFGRAAHQAPEVDGTTTVHAGPAGWPGPPPRPGELLAARVVGSCGVDLVAERLPAGALR